MTRNFFYSCLLSVVLLLGCQIIRWLLLRWMLLRWLLVRWSLLRWLILRWLLLGQLLLGEIGCLGNPYFLLTDCLDIQFFDSLRPTVFPTQSVKIPFVTFHSLCSPCVAYRTPCHSIGGHQVLFIQPLHREAKNFPMGNKYFEHVFLLTWVIYFSEGVYMVGYFYGLHLDSHGTLSFLLALNSIVNSFICY